MRPLKSIGFATDAIAVVACACLCLAGCANSRTGLEDGPELWASSIHVGDQLRVTTHAGQVKDISVTVVDDSGISSSDGFISFSDIRSIQVINDASGGAGTTVILIVLGIIIVAGLASLITSEIDEGFIQPAQ